MPNAALHKKLLLKPGMKVRLLNAPDGYRNDLLPLPAGVTLADKRADGTCDLVHLFVRSAADLAEWAGEATGCLKPDGLFWVAYPKKSSAIKADIDRDHGWEPLAKKGLRIVSLFSIDETWSAARFRPREAAKR
jgi:hypothetical protein